MDCSTACLVRAVVVVVVIQVAIRVASPPAVLQQPVATKSRHVDAQNLHVGVNLHVALSQHAAPNLLVATRDAIPAARSVAAWVAVC